MNVVLDGKFIQLELLQESHRHGLQLAANHKDIWLYMPYQATNERFKSWFDDAMNKVSLGTQITYVIRNKKNQSIIGASAYYDIQKEHQRLTLGYTWHTPETWGTGVNLEAKLLMLEQAFEMLHMNRVELGTDSRNLRSYYAIKKLGAKEEGTLRQHMILHDNIVTDTIMFSILSAEWPTIKTKLKQNVG